MERLQQAVLLAAKIHEESWDPKAKNYINNNPGGYTVTLRKAADIAAEQVGFGTRGSKPVFLLLYWSWNDALAWAKGE